MVWCFQLWRKCLARADAVRVHLKDARFVDIEQILYPVMPTNVYTMNIDIETESQLAFRRYPLAWFFALAFLLDVVLLAVIVVMPYSLLKLLVELLYFWTPNISAVIVLRLVLREKDGVRKLVSGWTKWRVDGFWYLVALSPLFIDFVSAGVYVLLGNTPPGPEEDMDFLSSLLACVFRFFYWLVTAGLGEELGWRGFALPRLQAHYNALESSIILGVIWGLWHLPGWLVGTIIGASYDMRSFLVVMLSTVPASILITWVFNNTQGSLLLASFFHTSWNFSASLVAVVMGLISVESLQVISIILLAIYAVIVVVRFGPDRLSRKHE
ncbi:MAG: type II CAAX prenyl endopeptidase Rce1 family protein [Candidatus Bathyarchaeia archaeon]